MTSRSTLMLSSLALLGFAVMLAIRVLSASDPKSSADVLHAIESPAAPIESAGPAANPSQKRAAKEAPLPREEPATPAQVGQAKGNIRFEQRPAGKYASGARIDIDVKAALGLWQPGENRMRILLLESEPKRDQIAQLIDTIQSGGPGVAGNRSAVIELRFVPNAQAFDRNELESATLVVSDGALSSTADALNGLEWAGSLPSPQLELPPGSDRPAIDLTSNGDILHSDRVVWHQSWRLSLAVPVVMRNAGIP
jgi:hypothetical protein